MTNGDTYAMHCSCITGEKNVVGTMLYFDCMSLNQWCSRE